MLVREMNWMQMEAYLEEDDRAVLPLGSTEQHAYLSLLVDTILPERLAAEAAEPLGVPVFPAIPYGLSPYFTAFPGTVSLRVGTYLALVRDVLDGLERAGFRRILLVNGHGGNRPVGALALEWMADHPGCRVKLHDWWLAPRTAARIREVDPVASHASWMENFPWTRIPGVETPTEAKPPVDVSLKFVLPPGEFRRYMGDGSYGGRYAHPDEATEEVWAVAVEETREALEGPWGAP